MVAVTTAMSLNNAFSEKMLWMKTLMIYPCKPVVFHILARSAEAGCNQQKHMGLERTLKLWRSHFVGTRYIICIKQT